MKFDFRVFPKAVFDPTMVSEYSADIFEYLGELEVSFSYGEYQRLIICQNFTLPMHNYIQHQPKITWKYKETHIPSIGHFVNMTDYSYSKGILSTEPYVLKRLDFNLSNCSPYPWIRKISKTGHNIHNRTLCKFLMEATLLNGQFVGFKPSLVAAVGMFTAKKMLGESWVSSFSVHERY